MEKNLIEVQKQKNGQDNIKFNYEIDRNDDSFLKNAELIDVDKFDFDSQEFKDAVAGSLDRQATIDQIKNSSRGVNLSNIICTI